VSAGMLEAGPVWCSTHMCITCLKFFTP